ncbi:DUF4245 domain-containing protein [Nostocoides sp. HKS02]|uniref:DUF4245 domain-containing protein n=1 Tax=Nostocoides sp. HKS02 TaxID=1813880 RepID=UPI001E517798|nr:DUF4245 domain-containing protein [Tetrasphaera sp. HKS02]
MSTPAPRSSYANGSVANMIRSLLVIGVIVVGLIAIVPRVNTVSQPPVDVAGASVEIAKESGWPIERPVGLPDGWKATSVRYVRSTDGFMTWHAGYLSPTGNYVAIEQTQGPSALWIAAETNRARITGERQAGGRTWTTYVRDGKVQNKLGRQGGERQGPDHDHHRHRDVRRARDLCRGTAARAHLLRLSPPRHPR